jgi:preprotein translocase subunit SecD
MLLSMMPARMDQDNYKTIVLQASSKSLPAASLQRSAEIISERLSQYGLKSAKVKVVSDDNLQVRVPVNTEISDIEDLLTIKGIIEFYETYTHDEISTLFKNDNKLTDLLGYKNIQSPSDPRLGCSTENRQTAEGYIKQSQSVSCKLLWGRKNDCLFALKSSPLLSRTDIDSVKLTGTSGNLRIMIRLKPEAAGIFAEATRKNIDRCIAVVFDNSVFSYPRVRAEITGGKVEVTGDFTDKEVKSFPIIFQTSQLQTDFRITR